MASIEECTVGSRVVSAFRDVYIYICMIAACQVVKHIHPQSSAGGNSVPMLSVTLVGCEQFCFGIATVAP